MIKEAPIVFAPYLKSVIWGGDKICGYKGILQKEPKIGESWEISALPGHESVVVKGEYKGKNIVELIELYGEELLGKKSIEKYGKKFPLLIKFIDANDNLSVQVHPGDNLAMQRHNSLGKTEMWYIIQRDKNSKIYAGLKELLTPEEYVKKVEEGTFSDTLAIHDSNPGDVFFLPAGRVHAIGAGNLLAEIQESSDITYRIYDYDRKDSEGKTRELHTELAKDAIDYKFYYDYKMPVANDDAEEIELVNCEHFNTKKIRIKKEREFTLDRTSFIVLICIEGNAKIKCKDGEIIITAGHTLLLPAITSHVILSGNATLLSVRL